MRPTKSHHAAHLAAPRVPRCVGDHGHLELLNGGPFDLEDLAELFAAADANRLAGAWVACVVAALIDRYGPGAAAVARPLNVVAQRLHKPQPKKEPPCRRK